MWNWELPDWPTFTYDKEILAPIEEQFLIASGFMLGAMKYVSKNEQEDLRIELISEEALKTSKIEGEILNRDSLQSSLRRHFGLKSDDRRVSPAESGISEMMVDLWTTYNEPLQAKTLGQLHEKLMRGRIGLQDVGKYRTHLEPMQVISGKIGSPTIHFEAPPSQLVPEEMERFIFWFNESGPFGSKKLPPITRSAIAHLYFTSIHPFIDGNGRIGRAISEKALAQCLGYPSLIALAYTIERNRNKYYEALGNSSKDNAITSWLVYFGNMVLEAQKNTIKRVEFIIAKTRFYDQMKVHVNARQEKVINRIFREGIDGFKGGLSAENYISITKAPRTTATRDLNNLIRMGALYRTGQLKHTRYFLNLSKFLGQDQSSS